VDQKSPDYGAFARLNAKMGSLSILFGTTGWFGSVASRRFVNLNAQKGVLRFDADQRAHTIDVYGEGRYRLGRSA
jgi:iron complex outermembrane recepter protein